MLHFVNMFAMYLMILDIEDCFPFAMPIFLVSVYFTVFFWMKNNKSFAGININLLIFTLLFNFVGTILLMGFGIIITAPVTFAYLLMLGSVTLYRKSFCGYDTSKNVALFVTPVFFLAALAGGYTNWFHDDEAAIHVFSFVYIVLSTVVLYQNYKVNQSKAPVYNEEPVKKGSFLV